MCSSTGFSTDKTHNITQVNCLSYLNQVKVFSLSLTQVSLHLQLVGDSVNEKLVDIRHNTPDLHHQSHTRNTRHHSAGTKVHKEIKHFKNSEKFGGHADILTW